VADNGSTDDSQAIAASMGARVVHVEAKGYAMPSWAALSPHVGSMSSWAMLTTVMISLGSDPSLKNYVKATTWSWGIGSKAALNQGQCLPCISISGNPVLTGIGRLLFSSPCGDFHCGLRGFNKAAIMRLSLRTTGMEFASEMVVKATLYGLRIVEVPTTLSPDGRNRPPHLRSWRDGWRHLRFLLLYSPRWLFLYPGAFLMLIGLATVLWLLPNPGAIGHITLDVHTLLYAQWRLLSAFQAVVFAVFTKVFAISEGLLPEDPPIKQGTPLHQPGGRIGCWRCPPPHGAGRFCVCLEHLGAHSFGLLDPSKVLRMVSLYPESRRDNLDPD